MATVSTQNFENDKHFCETARSLYGEDISGQGRRYAGLAAMHAEIFGRPPVDFFSSPGRIEIVGNHTDHNAGRVLAAAITVDTLAAVSPRSDGVIEVKSEGYPTLRAEIGRLEFAETELGTSVALIKGVADYYIRAGKGVGGFSACMHSTVPKGSGVSSSSSFELMVAEILNVYYNGGELDPIFKAKASQYAEKIYFGKPCGLMDQCSIALGGVNLIDFVSFDNPVVVGTVWGFDDIDTYVVATGGDHSDLNDDYAAIPAEMKRVAEAMGAKLLREISPEAFYDAESGLRGKLPQRALLRAEHFYEENVRVGEAFDAVEKRDAKAFLAAVNSSGASSAVKLQNLFSEKSGDRSLEEALRAASGIDGVRAKRVHGGGFAGTILIFAEKAKRSGVNDALNRRFGKENVFRLSIRNSGARRLDLGR